MDLISALVRRLQSPLPTMVALACLLLAAHPQFEPDEWPRRARLVVDGDATVAPQAEPTLTTAQFEGILERRVLLKERPSFVFPVVLMSASGACGVAGPLLIYWYFLEGLQIAWNVSHSGGFGAAFFGGILAGVLYVGFAMSFFVAAAHLVLGIVGSWALKRRIDQRDVIDRRVHELDGLLRDFDALPVGAAPLFEIGPARSPFSLALR